MRLNVSLLVLAFTAATGVVGVPVTIDDGANSASSHQLIRRGWLGGTFNFLRKFLPPKSTSIESIVGIGILTMLPTIPFVWDTARTQERKDIERAIAERRRKAYEREENKKIIESQDGESAVDPEDSNEDGAQSQDSEESSNQPSLNESGQAVVNDLESQVELRDPPTNYLPPSGPIRSGVFDEGESGQGDTDSLAGESQNNRLEDDANAGQTSNTPDDQQGTREKSIEEVLMEDDTA